jgi:hypothetical protein
MRAPRVITVGAAQDYDKDRRSRRHQATGSTELRRGANGEVDATTGSFAFSPRVFPVFHNVHSDDLYLLETRLSLILARVDASLDITNSV